MVAPLVSYLLFGLPGAAVYRLFNTFDAMIGPTFGEYRAASQAAGASVVEWRAMARTSFHLDIPAMISWICQEQPALIWLCNPNNPTGTWLPGSVVTRLAAVCQQIQAALVIDEAYWHFLIPHETFSAIDLLATSREKAEKSTE